MAGEDLRGAVEPVVGVLDDLGVPYYLTGSVVSTAYGVARSTLDADLVAEMNHEHAALFVERLSQQYYVDLALVNEAVHRRSSFNLVHFDTMLKVDVFVSKGDAVERARMDRRRRDALWPGIGREFWVASPEDSVLSKLAWYKAGGEVSEKQWTDILGVLRVQDGQLDRGYMHDVASILEVGDLLERAVAQAGS